jgi:energy-coupling factor transporter ATP-binding protein EcfA2
MAKSSNPFATRFVQPGAISFQMADGQGLEVLIEDFWQRCHGRAAIVGPHGSGKSTLLASLRGLFERQKPVFQYRLSASDRDSDQIWRDRLSWTPESIVILDGYEQLSLWRAWRLNRWTIRKNLAWLVTAHQPVSGLPTLIDTTIDESIAIQLRDQLLRDRSELAFHPALESAWTKARTAHPTDLRETWMAMYDWVEDMPTFH